MTEDEIREFLKYVLMQPGSQENHIEAIVDQWVDAQYEFHERRMRNIKDVSVTLEDDI